MSLITDNRKDKFERVAAFRQNMTVILENVHDPHNIGAVLRSCDAVGIDEIFVLYSDLKYDFEKLEYLNSSSTGVRKWMQVHCFRDIKQCFESVKKRYNKVLATHLNNEATSIYDNDLTEKIAFLFGNERDGLTNEALEMADGNIKIPQFGMAQSLNISVACAITIYEAQRQRNASGLYKNTLKDNDSWRNSIYKRFVDKQEESYRKS